MCFSKVKSRTFAHKLKPTLLVGEKLIMIKITLPDGSIREYQKGTTSLQVALSISEGLARNVLAAKINGEVWDATRPLNQDCNLTLLTWKERSRNKR